MILCFRTSLIQLQLYDHLEEHDKAFAVSTPWELDAGVDVESAEYQAEEDRLFFHCEKFFLSFRKYLEEIDEASDYLEEELLRYLKRQGYKYQKIMLAEGKIGPEDVYTGFERELSTDWEDNSDEKVDSQPASQKVEEPSVNDDQHRYSNSLTSEQNAAEIDAILAEVMSQTH